MNGCLTGKNQWHARVTRLHAVLRNLPAYHRDQAAAAGTATAAFRGNWLTCGFGGLEYGRAIMNHDGPA